MAQRLSLEAGVKPKGPKAKQVKALAYTTTNICLHKYKHSPTLLQTFSYTNTSSHINI